MEFSIDRESTKEIVITTFDVIEVGTLIKVSCRELGGSAFHLPFELFSEGTTFKKGDVIEGLELWHTDYGGTNTFLEKRFRKREV